MTRWRLFQVAIGKLPVLTIYGDQFDTPDGSGVRDYIHIVDLARGHVKALDHIKKEGFCFLLCSFPIASLQDTLERRFTILALERDIL